MHAYKMPWLGSAACARSIMQVDCPAISNDMTKVQALAGQNSSCCTGNQHVLIAVNG
jgi:hypothetical protein